MKQNSIFFIHCEKSMITENQKDIFTHKDATLYQTRYTVIFPECFKDKRSFYFSLMYKVTSADKR